MKKGKREERRERIKRRDIIEREERRENREEIRKNREEIGERRGERGVMREKGEE